MSNAPASTDFLARLDVDTLRQISAAARIAATADRPAHLPVAQVIATLRDPSYTATVNLADWIDVILKLKGISK